MEAKRSSSSATGIEGARAFFRGRELRYLACAGCMLAVTFGASLLVDFSPLGAVAAFPKAFRWMAVNLLPDARALVRLPDILRKLVDTVLVSIMASVTAAVGALLFALLGSRTTRPHPSVALFARGAASLFRNIPVVAWAMILLFSFGQSSFTGYIALTLESFGFLTRAFMETIDEAAMSSVEALRATGATYAQTVVQAVLPGAMPQMTSWILFMIETNIRSATLIGMLTGTGIGFAFDLYYKSLAFHSAALVVVCVVVAVLAIEFLSNTVRRIIL